ncbi:MAG: hypothetical protein GX608_10640, partial [Lentisphaerae bacterium]|nr:hypothetical protein [Lentisphaerota bacterium]
MNRAFLPAAAAAAAVCLCVPWSRAGAWTNLAGGFNHAAFALAFDPQGGLYAAGEFTEAGGAPANRIARWNGSAWTPLAGERAGGNVYELAAAPGGALYTAGGTDIEAWNGSAWTNLSAGIDWYVYALACD